MRNNMRKRKNRKSVLIVLYVFLICIQGCFSTPVEELKSPNRKVRESAAKTLWLRTDPSTVEPLIAALEDEYHDVRKYAAYALGDLNDSRAIGPLLVALKKDPCIAFSYALADIHDPKATEALIEALKHENFLVRKYAVDALGKPDGYPARYRSTAEVLITVLKQDKHPKVRRTAAWRLWHLRDRRSVEPLITALSDEDEGVRHMAVSALSATPDLRAIEPLMEFLKGGWIVRPRDGEPYLPQFKFSAAIALASIGKPAIEPLIAALNHDDIGVRMGAARALKSIRDPRVDRTLKRAMEEQNLEIIAAAHQFFIEIGKPGSERLLIEALNKHGYADMARNFIFCGNAELRRVGNQWTKSYGYFIMRLGHNDGPIWGSSK